MSRAGQNAAVGRFPRAGYMLQTPSLAPVQGVPLSSILFEDRNVIIYYIKNFILTEQQILWHAPLTSWVVGSYIILLHFANFYFQPTFSHIPSPPPTTPSTLHRVSSNTFSTASIWPLPCSLNTTILPLNHHCYFTDADLQHFWIRSPPQYLLLLHALSHQLIHTQQLPPWPHIAGMNIVMDSNSTDPWCAFNINFSMLQCFVFINVSSHIIINIPETVFNSRIN